MLSASIQLIRHLVMTRACLCSAMQEYMQCGGCRVSCIGVIVERRTVVLTCHSQLTAPWIEIAPHGVQTCWASTSRPSRLSQSMITSLRTMWETKWQTRIRRQWLGRSLKLPLGTLKVLFIDDILDTSTTDKILSLSQIEKFATACWVCIGRCVRQLATTICRVPVVRKRGY